METLETYLIRYIIEYIGTPVDKLNFLISSNKFWNQNSIIWKEWITWTDLYSLKVLQISHQEDEIQYEAIKKIKRVRIRILYKLRLRDTILRNLKHLIRTNYRTCNICNHRELQIYRHCSACNKCYKYSICNYENEDKLHLATIIKMIQYNEI